MKYEYLEDTSGNHNKFYEMTENAGGNWTAKWGKIGTGGTTKDYPMTDWHKKLWEKEKKGYVNLTHTKAPPEPEFKTNKEHLKKVNKVFTVLNVNKDDIVGSKEHIRDVGAIRKSLKDKKSMLKGNLAKDDMVYLNDLWKKIQGFAKKS